MDLVAARHQCHQPGDQLVADLGGHDLAKPVKAVLGESVRHCQPSVARAAVAVAFHDRMPPGRGDVRARDLTNASSTVSAPCSTAPART
jgi:hypothetical protein